MKCDVFRELPLIKTTSGTLTIEETLKRLGDRDFFLNQSIDGLEFGASWRLLTSITAVCLQCEPEAAKEPSLPLSAINKGLATLFEAENLFGGRYPFFQRLPVPTQKANKPTWKLSPTVPSNESQSYWDLDKFKPETMQLSQAAMALIVFATYSLVGNSKYDGSKCLNGSPGVCYSRIGDTATEIFIKSDTLYESILKSIPKSWIKPGGLPAWADRTGEKSLLSDGSMHPLWQAIGHPILQLVSGANQSCWASALVAYQNLGSSPKWAQQKKPKKPGGINVIPKIRFICFSPMTRAS